jgi:hypothetical protein
MTRDLDLAIIVTDLNFRQASFVQQFGELAHQLDIDLHDSGFFGHWTPKGLFHLLCQSLAAASSASA